MQVSVLGINHKTAPLEIRERLALTEEQLKPALDHLKKRGIEGVILSTCNRTEIYATFESGSDSKQKLSQFLVDHYKLSPNELSEYTYFHEGPDAVAHLMRVSSGIDSQIIGETQVLGQVQRALVSASEAGATNHPISRLFHSSLRTGRRARRETMISRHAVSISFAAVELARKFCGDLRDCTVLVISAGEAGKLTAKTLRDSGAKELIVTSRTYQNAVDLAEQLEGRPTPFAKMPAALADADIVISATASPTFVVDQKMAAAAMARRPERPLFMVDIAVPRDIDPLVAAVPNLMLKNIDDLTDVSESNLAQRKKEIHKVESIIKQETAKFMDWWATLDAVSTVAELQQRADEIRATELERSMKRMPGLTPEQRERIDAMTKAIVKRMLHHPIISIKEGSSSKGHIKSARDLFRLNDKDSQ